MYFDFVNNLCLKHFLFSEELSEILSQMYIRPHVKYPLFLSDFNETLIFSTDFQKNPQISIFMKVRLLRAELFHAGGQTDMTKLTVALRNFMNAPKTQHLIRGARLVARILEITLRVRVAQVGKL
jgi:hypothetical protein